MPDTNAGPNRWRSIWAVVAGFLAVVILSTLVDVILHALKIYPPWNERFDSPALNALALSYRIVFTLFGGWLTARLAPWRPVKHAVILAFVGLPLGVAGAVVGIMKDLGPAWYPIALAIVSPFCAWWGGVWQARSKA